MLTNYTDDVSADFYQNHCGMVRSYRQFSAARRAAWPQATAHRALLWRYENSAKTLFSAPPRKAARVAALALRVERQALKIRAPKTPPPPRRERRRRRHRRRRRPRGAGCRRSRHYRAGGGGRRARARHRRFGIVARDRSAAGRRGDRPFRDRRRAAVREPTRGAWDPLHRIPLQAVPGGPPDRRSREQIDLVRVGGRRAVRCGRERHRARDDGPLLFGRASSPRPARPPTCTSASTAAAFWTAPRREHRRWCGRPASGREAVLAIGAKFGLTPTRAWFWKVRKTARHGKLCGRRPRAARAHRHRGRAAVVRIDVDMAAGTVDFALDGRASTASPPRKAARSPGLAPSPRYLDSALGSGLRPRGDAERRRVGVSGLKTKPPPGLCFHTPARQ